LATPSKISPTTLAKLAKLGIHHRSDLLLHLPLRYEDETHLTPIADAQPGMTVQVQGVVTHSEVMFRPRRSLVCRLMEGHEELTLRFLNFYPSQQKQLAVGKKIRAIGEVRLRHGGAKPSGAGAGASHLLPQSAGLASNVSEVRMGYFGLEMVHPKCRAADDDTPLQQSLTPIYPTTAGLAQPVLRKLINNALETIPLTDTLPAPLLKKLRLAGFGDSLRLLHNPEADVSATELEAHNHAAWRRIKFDELLAQQLSMRVHHRERNKRIAPALPPHQKLTSALLKKLPFKLTGAQQKVWQEIAHDLALAHPMQRLLLGDVGSGKTIVAALAALQAIENGYQVAFMAPTEILAEQHYLKLSEWLVPLGIEPVWLSGSLKKKDKTAAAERIASGDTLLAIGTHALFQASVEFNKLGLVIVDEQHKFGVHQRLSLRNKGDEPHQLMMSATPIPRTLAMSYYADLDVSVIDELPPGRTPIVTKLVSDARRDEVFERVRAACLAGRQAYWVCPLIEESDALEVELQNAIETHQQLTEALPELKVGLAHGRLPPAEKAAVMAAFKAGELHLLVATTVIEVGVDVPNASLMVIDHAERMGLAQLHQLRGRVGRGAAESMCVLLFMQPLSELARERLKVIYENTDGFVIAQQDLQLRGPGELLGARQSGVAMLRFADLTEDEDLLEQARLTADELLRNAPDVARAHLQRWMANKHDFLQV
jgi:ATP-dependent DNA helicase RecG